MQAATTGNPAKRLTSRDLEILRLFSSQGLAQIAEALGVSYKTVANICSGIKAKLGVSRTADLGRLSIEIGFACPSGLRWAEPIGAIQAMPDWISGRWCITHYADTPKVLRGTSLL